MPAATSAEAFCGLILCSSTPMVVMTTISGSPVADRIVQRLRAAAESRTRRKKTKVGSPRVTRNSTVNIGTRSSTFGLWISACRSKLIPLSMKKIGMRNPNPMASSLLVICSVSSPRMKRRTTTPAAKAPSSTSRLSLTARYTRRTTRVTEMRTGSWADEFRWRRSMATKLGRVHLGGQQRGHHGDDDEHHEEEQW